MKQESAHVTGIRALAWLASEDELFDAFLGASGADAGSVRALAAEPGFAASVLDFILQSDAWVITCAEAIGVRPEALGQARAVLGGGDQRHWT